ncbi:DUF4055 domain-containing protein [Lysobacter sp. HA35]
MPIAVNEPNDEIKALRKQWSVLDALLGGTPAMREGGCHLLPKWPNEEQAAYNARLATATLFPAYRRTVGVMAGKPFSKTLTLKDAPPQIEAWAEDIDRQGVSLHTFAAEMFEESFHGLAGILVEYPRVGENAPATVADAEAAGLRPYWVRVKHGQILGWRATMTAVGLRLTQLRLKETVDEPDGDWGTKPVDQVRVLEPRMWRTFRKDKDGNWVENESGITTLDVVPFVPVYGFRRGFMVGEPPLADLAYLNVKHWQSQSDQDTILHVARVPILAVIGVEDETWQLTVGASTAVKLPPQGDMKFVEHSGAAIAAGQSSLEALEQQMIQTGAELMVKKPGARTATESSNDAEANKSDLQRLAENFADALDQALWLTAQYARLGDKAGNVQLFDDYGAATLSDASAQLVKDLQMAGLISKETAIKELQRRGVLSADIDPADELEAAAADGPALATVPDPMANAA